mmetsp:Transcript_26608/g.88240  ORF Transcript_26608/g.88240 Transcript_26608/m.88240 type:complete len:211 (-) Transcript_26608:2341-2973(-)
MDSALFLPRDLHAAGLRDARGGIRAPGPPHDGSGEEHHGCDCLMLRILGAHSDRAAIGPELASHARDPALDGIPVGLLRHQCDHLLGLDGRAYAHDGLLVLLRDHGRVDLPGAGLERLGLHRIVSQSLPRVLDRRLPVPRLRGHRHRPLHRRRGGLHGQQPAGAAHHASNARHLRVRLQRRPGPRRLAQAALAPESAERFSRTVGFGRCG